MNPAALLSTASGVLCLLLSAVFYIKSAGVQSLSSDIQKKQQENQTQGSELQLKQDAFQEQQAKIEAGVKLAQQVGPAVLNDLGVLARDNKNDKIKKLLENYGVTINEKAPEEPKKQP
jgi:hypothetical protein